MKLRKKRGDGSKRIFLKLVLLCLSIIVSVCMLPQVMPETFGGVKVEAARKSQKFSIYIGKKLRLSVSNFSGKIRWSSSNKKIAPVSRRGIVTGKKAGSATISARFNGQILRCRVTVKRQYPVIKTKDWMPNNKLYLRIKNPTRKRMVVYPQLKCYDIEDKYYATLFLARNKSIVIPAGKTKTLCFSGNIDYFQVTDSIEEYIYYDYLDEYGYDYDDDYLDYERIAYEDYTTREWAEKITFDLRINGEKIKCIARGLDEDDRLYYDELFSFSFRPTK